MTDPQRGRSAGDKGREYETEEKRKETAAYHTAGTGDPINFSLLFQLCICLQKPDRTAAQIGENQSGIGGVFPGTSERYSVRG